MRKLLLLVPVLISLSSVFAISCGDQCLNDGFGYYTCTASDLTGSYSCHQDDTYGYCYNSYTEKFGTTCADRCFCFDIHLCGQDNTECGTACSSSGCSGTTLDITSISDLPSDTFYGDYSSWDVNWDNTGGIAVWTLVECHVRDPSGDNYYPSHGCSYIYSGSSRTAEEQIQVNEVGTWELLSCAVYEAQGVTPCSEPYIYRDEYDFSPVHTWEVTSSDCPPTTFGQCESYQDGYYQCFANHIGYCEYYSTLGLYCWTDFRDCETFYSPPRYCDGGACMEYEGTTTTTTSTTTTITGTTTTTTTILTTTTEEIPTQDLGEPFETDDMPNELRFLNNLSAGLFNMSGAILGGLVLLVFALSVATVIIFVGKRSL